MSEKILRRLGYDEGFIKEVCLLIKYHDPSVISIEECKEKNFYINLYKIQYCDALAHHPDKLEKRLEYLNEVKPKIMKLNDKM